MTCSRFCFSLLIHMLSGKMSDEVLDLSIFPMRPLMRPSDAPPDAPANNPVDLLVTNLSDNFQYSS